MGSGYVSTGWPAGVIDHVNLSTCQRISHSTIPKYHATLYMSLLPQYSYDCSTCMTPGLHVDSYEKVG